VKRKKCRSAEMNVPVHCIHCNREIGPLYPIYLELRKFLIADYLEKNNIAIDKYRSTPYMDINGTAIFESLGISMMCCTMTFTGTRNSDGI
jgi:DNA-directed RNA polymerase subunit N (RpoN/RPB10)